MRGRGEAVRARHVARLAWGGLGLGLGPSCLARLRVRARPVLPSDALGARLSDRAGLGCWGFGVGVGVGVGFRVGLKLEVQGSPSCPRRRARPYSSLYLPIPRYISLYLPMACPRRRGRPRCGRARSRGRSRSWTASSCAPGPGMSRGYHPSYHARYYARWVGGVRLRAW